MCLYLYGCLEFESIEQPSSVLPGESFTVLIEVTVVETGGEGPWSDPIFGICLPVGWTIPGDTIEFTGAGQGSIIYDPDISLEQEDLNPAPEGYYWWLGTGSTGDPVADTVFAEVPIQTDLQPGRYSLDYLLDSGFLDESAHGGPRLYYDLSDAERSDQHVIEVVDEWAPRELNALPRGSSVVLTWLPPLEKEGLAGYRVYRDGELVYTLPAETTEILDEDLAVDAVYHYSASAVYSDATEHVTPYEIEARIFSGGTGEPNDPYQLALADQLFHLADHRHLWDKAYVLVNDIDLHPDQTPRAPFSQAVIHRFAGIFDGNDHAISNMMITGRSYLGLFGRLESSAQVFDLNVIDVNMIGSNRFVGGLAGDNDGSISGCCATGIVSGGEESESYGGLVGSNGGSIASSYSAGTVSGGRLSGSHGGLVGSNGGSIATSCSTSTVSGGWGSFGGLVGYNDGSITASYSTGTVSGEKLVGGLVGDNDGSIATSYSTGSVRGSSSVGGLVGLNDGSIATSYSTGTVSGDSSVGGLVGEKGYWSARGSITTSFWDMETSDSTVSNGGIGLTTAEMMDPNMLGLNGFANNPNWVLDAGFDYPRLTWEGTAGQVIPEPIIDWLNGQGTEEEPYRIETAHQLILLTRASGLWDKHFILGADIDLDPNLQGRRVFSQAVIQVFSGVFDGNGHVISHLTIVGDSCLGLFGQLGPGARISNLALETVNVNGTRRVGGLVGFNDGSITSCYSTGTVTGRPLPGQPVTVALDIYCVGGLVGSNSRDGGSITASYSTGTVSGIYCVGGLVGDNDGSIATSYSTGSVTGRGNYVDGLRGGGLVGRNSSGLITTSYSTGSVSGTGGYVGGLVGENMNGSITSSFWDIQTSAQATSDGGTGATTAEMQTAGTFLEAGWDFVDEIIDGTEEIWWILEGQDYPRLWWELPPEN